MNNLSRLELLTLIGWLSGAISNYDEVAPEQMKQNDDEALIRDAERLLEFCRALPSSRNDLG